MKNLTSDTILQTLHEQSKFLKDKFGVVKVGLFGSYIRIDADENSDIDLLVEFENPSFDNYMDLKFHLEDLFKKDVDLVMIETIKPRIKPHIMNEVHFA